MSRQLRFSFLNSRSLSQELLNAGVDPMPRLAAASPLELAAGCGLLPEDLRTGRSRDDRNRYHEPSWNAVRAAMSRH